MASPLENSAPPQKYSSIPPIILSEQRPGSQLGENNFDEHGFPIAQKSPRLCGPIDVDVETFVRDKSSSANFINPFAVQSEEQTQAQLLLSSALPLPADAYAHFQMAKEGLSPLVRGMRNFFMARADYHNRMSYYAQHPESHDFSGLRGALFKRDNLLGRAMAALHPQTFAYADAPDLYQEDFWQRQRFYDRWAFRFGNADKGIRLFVDATAAARVFEGELNARSVGGLTLAGLDAAQAVQSLQANLYYVEGNQLRQASEEQAAALMAKSQKLYMRVGIIQTVSGGIRLIIELSQDQMKPTSLAFAVLDLAEGATSTAYSMQLLHEASKAATAAERSRVLLNVARTGDRLRIGLGVIGMFASALSLGLSVYVYCEVNSDPNIDPKIRERFNVNSLFGILGNSTLLVAGALTCARLFSWATALTGTGLIFLAAGFFVDYFVFSDDD